jgi:hypothetical protein
MRNIVLTIQENRNLLNIYRTISSFIQLIPYYVIEEFYAERNKVICPLAGKDTRFSFLTRDDMELLGNHQVSNAPTQELIRLLDDGCLCLAVRYKGEIAAYSWCDMNYLRYKERKVALNPNEAYLFDARTYKAFRGKNLAPYVRHELCKLMNKRGIERFFSITLWSNSASMKFKQKLGARPIELFLYVGLFRRYSMHLRLRTLAFAGQNKASSSRNAASP